MRYVVDRIVLEVYSIFNISNGCVANMRHVGAAIWSRSAGNINRLLPAIRGCNNENKFNNWRTKSSY